MKEMNNFSITETEFALLIGKIKLYSFLDKETKRNLFHLNINDNQINSIIKDYHIDPNFARFENGNIDLWRLYNIFTEELVKVLILNTNFEKNVNAYEFINYLANSIKNNKGNWFLH